MSIGTKIYNLRQKAKMSQEEFAALFGVSRQAVQKWENDTSLPEVSKLIELSKFFGISIDCLLLDRKDRILEDMRFNQKILPYYEDMPDWEFYGSALSEEYRQSYDEGLDIAEYEKLFDAVNILPKGNIKKELCDTIQKIVQALPSRKDYPYIEPSDWEGIRALRKPHIVPSDDLSCDSSLFEQKIHGAWLGRICGCMLGKTVEGIRTPELIRFLKETDNYPLDRYIQKSDLKKVDLSTYNYDFAHRCYIDECDGMPADDDTNYTVLAQRIFDTYGKSFTSENVATAWLQYQPKDAYCTAERVAFCNFIKGYRPPQSALYQNPYREWIGAQIRADYWGYINPNDPEKAAEYALRDACISHVKNGIYGAMFVAAMLAVAARTDCMEDIVLSGAAQIPATSRLYEDIHHIVSAYRSGKSISDTIGYIHSRYDENSGYGWCHTNSNAMIVTACLLYGGGNYERSVCAAVEAGFDTDCNGATVGSVVGMAKGVTAIPSAWTTPIQDRLHTSIFGVDTVRISDCVRLTLSHIKQNTAH